MSVPVVAETHVLIIGGGQAGLATSALLQQRGLEHIVLERAPHVAEAWRTGRWDSFNLITPNVQTFCLPGTAYAGNDPWGFDDLNTVIEYFEQYAETFRVPIAYDVEVTALRKRTDGQFQAETPRGAYLAQQVVVATGYYAIPRIPAMAAALPSTVQQLHTHDYSNPQSLPPGAVLIVGSANSGAQVAEELNAAGRTVYLAVGSTAQVPRRYRGRDMLDWALNVGVPLNPASNITGKRGGDDLNLHRLSHDGVRLVGRLTSVDGEAVSFAADLHDHLIAQDAAYARFIVDADTIIEQQALVAPAYEPHPDASLRDGYSATATPSLDLHAAGISTVIWGTGYRMDHRWVDLPVLDAAGQLMHERGVTAVPGLYCVGMSRPVITGRVGAQAAEVVEHLATA